VNKQFVQEVGGSSDYQQVVMFGYDKEMRAYRCWIFPSQVTAHDSVGQWDEKSKTLTTTEDLKNGITSYSSLQFVDKDKHVWTAKAKDKDGKVFFHMEGKVTRKKTLAAWSKSEKPDAALSPETKVLERLIGTWDTVTVAKPAEWTPEEVRTTSTMTRTWALDKSVVMESSQQSDGKEGLSMFTYDPKQKAYRHWWFGSEGHSTSTCQWDDVSETLSFLSEDNGLTSRGAMRFIDDDHHDHRLVVTDGNGKLYLDMKWTTTRSKK